MRWRGARELGLETEIPLPFQRYDRAEDTGSEPGADSAEPLLRSLQSARPRVGGKVIWNIVIGVAGVSYILMMLCLNVESPLFAGLLIAVAGYEVVESRLGRTSGSARR
jgi:hypothetical protein